MSKPYDVTDWYWYILGDDSRAWSSKTGAFVAPTAPDFVVWLESGGVPTNIGSVSEAMTVVIKQTGMMGNTDLTMNRIAEAVALGDSKWTGSDVVAFVNYRRALRAIVGGSDTKSDSLPIQPPYPSGT